MFFGFQRKQRRDHSSPIECKGEGGKEGGEGEVHNVIVEPYGRSKFCQNFIVCPPPPPLTERYLIFLRQSVRIRQAVCN